MLRGNDLILSLDGVRLAASRTCSVDRQTDTIESCSPTNGSARKYIPSTTGWSITAGGLYANTEGAERLREIWRKYQKGIHEPLEVRYTTAGGVEEVGEAILTDLQEQGDVNSLAKFSIQLQGSGELKKPDPVPIDMSEYDARFDGYFIRCNVDGVPTGILYPSEGDYLLAKEIGVSKPSVLTVYAKSGDACVIVDQKVDVNDADSWLNEGTTPEGRIFHFIEPQYYLGHVHGGTPVQSIHLNVGPHLLLYRGDEQYEVTIE